MVSRYCDHLPWYRIEGIYAGLGVKISRQTLCNWGGMAADASQLVVKETARSVFADGKVQIDETSINYLVPGHGQTKTGCLWVAHNAQRKETLFTWHTSRAAACLESLVPAEFRGASSATATVRMRASHKARRGADASIWQVVWPTCGASFLRHRRKAQTRNGCSARCSSFIKSKHACARHAPARRKF